MIKKDYSSRIIGNENIKTYQLISILFGSFMSFTIFLFNLIEPNTNNLVILFICVVFCLLISYLYSKLYIIKRNVNGEVFEIFNLFSKREEKASDYLRVRVVFILPFILKVYFKSYRSYYFMADSKSLFTSLFTSKQNILNNIDKQFRN